MEIGWNGRRLFVACMRGRGRKGYTRQFLITSSPRVRFPSEHRSILTLGAVNTFVFHRIYKPRGRPRVSSQDHGITMNGNSRVKRRKGATRFAFNRHVYNPPCFLPLPLILQISPPLHPLLLQSIRGMKLFQFVIQL